MSDIPDAGISFSVPSQAPGMIIGGGCPLLYEEGLGRRAAAGGEGAAAAAPRAFPCGPPGAPPPGTFWNEESSSSSACPDAAAAAAARAKAGGGGGGGGGGSNRRTTVSYVINEESPALLQTAESGALQSLKEACEAVGASLETLHFGKLDFGETAVLDRFYNADIAVVEMSDAFRQPSLFYHLGVRESFSMANNIILYCDTNADSLQSLKEIICQKNNPKSSVPQKPTRSMYHAEDAMYWSDDLKCDCPHGIKSGLRKKKEKSIPGELEIVSEDEGYESMNWGNQADYEKINPRSGSV